MSAATTAVSASAAAPAPRATRASTLIGSRSVTVTSKPASSRFRAIGAPMLPRPMNASLSSATVSRPARPPAPARERGGTRSPVRRSSPSGTTGSSDTDRTRTTEGRCSALWYRPPSSPGAASTGPRRVAGHQESRSSSRTPSRPPARMCATCSKFSASGRRMLGTYSNTPPLSAFCASMLTVNSLPSKCHGRL